MSPVTGAVLSGKSYCCRVFKMYFLAILSTASEVPSSSIMLERRQTSLRLTAPEANNSELSGCTTALQVREKICITLDYLNKPGRLFAKSEDFSSFCLRSLRAVFAYCFLFCLVFFLNLPSVPGDSPQRTCMHDSYLYVLLTSRRLPLLPLDCNVYRRVCCPHQV